MKLTKLDIVNFRNYSKLSLDFNDNINIFIGNNGEGKTNILPINNFLNKIGFPDNWRDIISLDK